MKEKNHPLGYSRMGDNSYCVSCKTYNASRHYAVCLRIIEAQESGAPKTTEPDCNKAIGCLECPAVKLRDAEEEAGHSLYYTPRNVEHLGNTKITDDSYQKGWGERYDGIKRNRVAPVAAPKPKPKPKSKPKKKYGTTHADLVNKLLEEESAQQ